MNPGRAMNSLIYPWFLVRNPIRCGLPQTVLILKIKPIIQSPFQSRTQNQIDRCWYSDPVFFFYPIPRFSDQTSQDRRFFRDYSGKVRIEPDLRTFSVENELLRPYGQSFLFFSKQLVATIILTHSKDRIRGRLPVWNNHQWTVYWQTCWKGDSISTLSGEAWLLIV